MRRLNVCCVWVCFYYFLFFYSCFSRQSLSCAMLQHVSSPCPSKSKPKFNPECKADNFPCRSKRQQAMQNAIRSNTISSHRPQGAAMAPICLLCTVCTVCTRIEERFDAMVGFNYTTCPSITFSAINGHPMKSPKAGK